MEAKDLSSPDEPRPFPKGKLEVINLGGVIIGRGTFETGWTWSECVTPIAGTDSCQAPHSGYMVSGRMHVVMDDGSADDFGPGTVVVIPPGHDAWLVSNEPGVFVDSYWCDGLR